MGKETIMLAKTYKNHKSLLLPVQVTEKLDGVAADFFGVQGLAGVTCAVRSRQDEPLLSVDHITDFLSHLLPKGHHVIGELYIPGMDFKDISGLVRRKQSDEETAKLRLYIYDYYIEGSEDMEYITRMEFMYDTIGQYFGEKAPAKLIPGLYIESTEQFDAAVAKFKKDHPTSEGLVIRSLTGKSSVYKSGWRSPGMLKLKTTETIDLKIVSFEEAIDKDGAAKGMVGRINVSYKGKTIGVGPGKMNHKDRVEVFNNQKAYIGKMIEIAYMPDDSYDALREPRFYRFRPDKD